MKLINTDGLAFIGPGSEWFWTAVSGLVLAVTFIGIYRQLSIARSANAFEQVNTIASSWQSERITRHKLGILLALREGVDPEHLPDGATATILAYWDDVGLLVRSGHVDRRLVYESMSGACLAWWALLAPRIRRDRMDSGDRVSEHHEWLADVMTEMNRRRGAMGHGYDQAYLASALDNWIQKAQEELRLEEELRAVIVRPMSQTAPPVPPAPPLAAHEEAAPAAR